MPRTHVIITEETRGAFATVVDLPGVIIGRANVDRLIQDLDDELDKFEVGPDRELHYQVFCTGSDGREYFVRSKWDGSPDRKWLFVQLLDDVLSPFHDFPQHFVEDVSGVVGIVACERSDSMRWIGEQLERGDAFAVAVWEYPDDHDNVLLRQILARDDIEERPDIVDVEPFIDLTLGQLIDAAYTLSRDGGPMREPVAPLESYDGQALSFARPGVLH